MTRTRILSGLVAAAVVLSCGGDGGTSNTQVPTPGNLTVVLDASATAGAGAIEILVTGTSKAIDTVVASAGYTAYLRRITNNQFRVVLIGTVTPGVLVTFHVPDTRVSSSYSSNTLAAANATTYAAIATSGFPVDIDRP